MIELETLLAQLDRLKARLDARRPLELSGILHALDIEYTYDSNRIEGNGRTARLVMNLILLQHGYPIANIPGDTKSWLAYYDALERCNLDGNEDPFQRLIANQVLESTKNLLKVLGEAP